MADRAIANAPRCQCAPYFYGDFYGASIFGAKKKGLHRCKPLIFWRRGWDSNPRYAYTYA